MAVEDRKEGGSSGPRSNITGIIHTYNSIDLLRPAIESLQYLADVVIVADMGSTDGTRELALELGAQIVDVPNFGYLEPALAVSHAQATAGWIFRLDSDEVLPRSSADAVRQAIDSGMWDAIELPRRNYMFGREIMGSGWELRTERHIRAYRVDVALVAGLQAHQVIPLSDGARVNRSLRTREVAFVHFAYTSWADFLRRLDRYTSIEARETLSGGRTQQGSVRIFASIIKELLLRLLRGKAWQDGAAGFALCALMVAYRLLAVDKGRNPQSMENEEDILSRYRAIAAQSYARTDQSHEERGDE